jgi:glycosyltransferase involved in cell wall biosynthesis
MKKLLIITYYWPPSGGAAVQRWLSFANKLTEKNYEIHILTVDEAYATFQLRDKSLVGYVHPAITVHKTKTLEPFGIFTLLFGKKSIPKPAFANETSPSLLKKAFRFLRGNLFIPDPRKGWKPFAIKKAVSIIQKEQIDCIITAGPPHSTHFIGKELKSKFKLRWIADFHDLWTDVIYYEMLYHLPAVKRIDAGLERAILESADVVLTVGNKYKEKLLSKSDKLAPEKVKVVRIGYDEKLFELHPEIVAQEKFIITYTGTIANFYHPETFIRCLKTVADRFDQVPLLLRFVGVLSDEIKVQIIKAGLSNLLEDYGYVSHKESVEFLKKSTILLLVNPVTKNEEMVIPGKIYEYLAAGKPIVNIAKAGSETESIITACCAGKTFDRTEEEALEGYLTELITEWQQNHKVKSSDNGHLILQYSTEKIVDYLISIIENSKIQFI